MSKKTIGKRFEYKLVRAELWGNAKDELTSNNWFTLSTKTTSEPLSERFCVTWARDHFAGCSFPWSENSSRPMSRKGIEVIWNDEHRADIHYRGHYVGEVQVDEYCHCGENVNAHWKKSCDDIRADRIKRRDRYVTGWNDAQYGLLTYPVDELTIRESYNGNDAQQWAKYRYHQAARLIDEGSAKGRPDDGYLRGVMDCSLQFQIHGKVDRLDK